MRIFCLLSGLLFSLISFSQNKYTISGFIHEKGSKENLPGVVIYQQGTNFSTNSNAYGFFSITLPAADSVKLVFSFVGYKTIAMIFELHKNYVIEVDLNAQNKLEEVEIIAQRNEKISQDIQMSKIDIPVEKVKEIPALLGEKDVLKVLQLLPGIQKGNEGSGGFYVRGGGPDQNLIILDDATVYNAFHLFGFFSLFNGDALKSIELFKGGFPARYGGRLSSVLDMQMKDGNKEKIHGEAGIGILSSRLTLEGPIIKDKCSFLFSARRTYIDALIYPFLPADQKGGYYFYDLNAKINYVVGSKDRLFLSGYFGQDRFYFNDKEDDYTNKASLSWGNATGTLRWNHVFNNKLFANTSFIFTDYKLVIADSYKSNQDAFSFQYSSGIRDYSGKIAFDFLPNPNHFIKFGFLSIYHQFSPGATAIKSSSPGENFNQKILYEAFENNLFFEDDWKITSKLRMNAGLRFSDYLIKSTNFFNPEPRLSLRYLLKKDFSIKASYALMNQYMHLLSNTGIGLPTDLWVPATAKAPFMQSQQGALGFAKDFTKQNIEVSIEGYYKEMKNVVAYKEGANFLNTIGDNGQPISWEDNVTTGKGWSYGTEVFIKKNAGKFTGWLGYTLSWTQLQFENLNFGKKFYARYDRRHDASVVGVYHINDKITVSATWVYGTGQAITLPINSYAGNIYSTPHTGLSSSPLNQTVLYQVQDYGQQRNNFRMAPYHRADIGIQFSRKEKRYTRVFELSVYNVYDRYNPYFYYIKTNPNQTQTLMQVSLFPLIPSVSWSWKF